MMKICTVCDSLKDLDQYYNRKASIDGKAYRCKDCDNQAVKTFRHKHRDRYLVRQRNSNLKTKYGLTEKEYDQLLYSQQGVCAICQGPPVNTNPPYNSKLVVDHNHNTGQIRGLLCQRCNQGLGLFKDSTTYLQSAIDYLS